MACLSNLAFLLALLSSTATSADELTDPPPLTPKQQAILDQYRYLQTEEKGPRSIFIGATAGGAGAVVWHAVASQALSKSKWLRAHCADCRPTDFKGFARRVLRDLPGFVGTGAAFGACDASGGAANSACLTAINTLAIKGIGKVVLIYRKDKKAKDFHIMDHIAGRAFLDFALDPLLPRGVPPPFLGRSTACRIGNGITEILGESLLSTAQSAAIDVGIRALHQQPLKLKGALFDGVVLAGIPSALERTFLVLTLGTRFRLSDKDRRDMLTYAQKRVGIDLTEAAEHADYRLSTRFMPKNGIQYIRSKWPITGSTNGNIVSVTPLGQELDRESFLKSLSHETMHVQQFMVLGALRDSLEILRNAQGPESLPAIEEVPELLD